MADSVLREQGFDVAPRGEELVGSPLAKALRSAFREADVAVFVLGASGLNLTTAYELGVATGLAIPMIVLSPPSARLPSAIRARGVVVWADAENLSIALSHALRDLKPRKTKRTVALTLEESALQAFETTRRADNVPAYSLPPDSWSLDARSSLPDRDLESIVRELVESTGVIVAAKAKNRSQPDLGVWVDELVGLVGAPLLIEVKARIASVAQADRAIEQLAKYVRRSGTEWGVRGPVGSRRFRRCQRCPRHARLSPEIHAAGVLDD